MHTSFGLVPFPLNPEITAYWTMWGTIATALVTGLLVFFAYRAWKAALATIKGQKDSAELAAVSEYMKALLVLANISTTTPQEFLPPVPENNRQRPERLSYLAYPAYARALTQDVAVFGSIWRAHHHATPEMGTEFYDAECTLIEGQQWIRDYSGAEPTEGSTQFDLNSAFATKLADLATQWQVDHMKRKEISAQVELEHQSFKTGSPSKPPTE